MSRAPRTSIVVPAYNHERFIGEALASLQAQTISDYEVVVVDDGSSDGTAEVARAIARDDDRIRVIGQPNRGSHGAINRGIAEARGPWVAVLNSDDRFAPTRLARLHEAAAEGARFVVSDARLIDEAGGPIDDPDHWWNRAMADFRTHADEHGAIEGLMYGNYTASTSNFFFERQLAAEIGPLRAMRRVLDWDWALRAALHAPSAFRYLRGEMLLDYRLHGRNTILGDPLPGTLEIHRVHLAVLRALSVPRTLLASMQRNRRELRRAWRDREVTRVERFVDDRQADIEQLREHLAQLEAHVARLQAELGRAADENAQLRSVATTLRSRLDQIENSRAWRALSAVRRIVRPDTR